MGAALVGAGGVVVGTIISAVLGIWAERRRSDDQERRDAAQRQHELDMREHEQTHELEMRQLELREEHRSRLHAERRAAYAEFYRCYRTYDGATRRLADAVWDLQGDDSGDDKIRARYVEATKAFAEVAPVLVESTTRVELVASTPVANAAAALRKEAADILNAATALSGTNAEMQDLRTSRMRQLETALNQSIREELELDR